MVDKEETFRESIMLRRDSDVRKARALCSEWSQRQGLRGVQRVRAATAVSEIARNCVLHGHGGTLYASVLRQGLKRGFRIQIVDQGPGILNVDTALGKGFSTGSGLGLGLGGAKALCGHFKVESNEGEGTTVVMDFWK